MGLNITLESSDGRRLGEVVDSDNALHRLLPRADDPSSPVLRHIDWYGDTVFNQLQIPAFLAEWATLRPGSNEERSLLDRVAALARRVATPSRESDRRMVA